MTPNDDTGPLITLSDVPAAIGLLSRLPIPVNTAQATTRGARAAWAYPLAGFVLAVLAGCVAHLSLSLGLSAPIAAGLTLACLIIISGALHEDGLSDAADGLWGAWEKSRRLEIMKDSRIGAYGVIALILGIGLRWQALTLVIDTSIWPTLIVTATLSRAGMVPLMCLLPHARASGLSHSVGCPPLPTAFVAIGFATVICCVLFQFTGLLILTIAGISTLCCALIAKNKIGGQTGDILGATQQVTEITILLTLAAVL